eukprot:CAMPEP_0197580192 /NCGR_PEP_ID=MMETSP1326-20131121/4046_1 /TAXON_ID=1155430 /ORGANISM="Genus nov. species nov., Strain RCC2288" /LENGTH=55 /DNA_ID=CAMNT_0043143879 /DNA_START=40 /DNA_END=204 /DNA_ORIENTATION=-
MAAPAEQRESTTDDLKTSKTASSPSSSSSSSSSASASAKDAARDAKPAILVCTSK